MSPQRSNDVGYLVSRFAKLLRASMARETQPLGVTPLQAAVILNLEPGQALTAGTMAELVASDRPTMTGLLGRMEREGLIRMEPNPDDGRSRLIVLAPKGKDLRRELRLSAARATKPALAGMSAEQVESFMDLLRTSGDRLAAHLAEERS